MGVVRLTETQLRRSPGPVKEGVDAAQNRSQVLLLLLRRRGQLIQKGGSQLLVKVIAAMLLQPVSPYHVAMSDMQPTCFLLWKSCPECKRQTAQDAVFRGSAFAIVVLLSSLGVAKDLVCLLDGFETSLS